MIYITGDTHSDFSRFTEENFPVQTEMTKNDYVIICGDFGGVWTFEEESSREKYFLDWLNSKNFTTLFVDGNHENFTRLYSYPVEEWHGGKVHKIRDSVLHLMRGEIFNIAGKKFFTFGGVKSHDIQDGILNLDEEERIYEYRKRGAYFRIRKKMPIWKQGGRINNIVQLPKVGRNELCPCDSGRKYKNCHGK